MDFINLATQLTEIKLTNMSSAATKEYSHLANSGITRKQAKRHHNKQILNDWAEQCRTIDVDVTKLTTGFQSESKTRESQYRTARSKQRKSMVKERVLGIASDRGRIILLQQNQTSPVVELQK
jgi:hypothetical protein